VTVEFLRFGSRISGTGIGCCAFDIIQGFDCDPKAKASIQLINGDGAFPITHDGKQVYFGPTNKDIFYSRLRVGTFYDTDMPNHGFLAVITENQLNYGFGLAWLKILKETGFEFVRAVDNSVYSGVRRNYLFALFRNAKDRGLDPFAPPTEWTGLPDNQKTQKEIWDELPKAKFLTEEELRKAGVPVYLAGTRGDQPKTKEKEERKETQSPWTQKSTSTPASPTSTSVKSNAVNGGKTVKTQPSWALQNQAFNLGKVPM
jgi:hypothetical protein